MVWAVGTTRTTAFNSLSRVRNVVADGFVMRKTTVKLPSIFSPKCCVRTASACSELVPGTANEVERRPGSRPAESAPKSKTANQQAMTTKRQRITTHDQ